MEAWEGMTRRRRRRRDPPRPPLRLVRRGTSQASRHRRAREGRPDSLVPERSSRYTFVVVHGRRSNGVPGPRFGTRLDLRELGRGSAPHATGLESPQVSERLLGPCQAGGQEALPAQCLPCSADTRASGDGDLRSARRSGGSDSPAGVLRRDLRVLGEPRRRRTPVGGVGNLAVSVGGRRRRVRTEPTLTGCCSFERDAHTLRALHQRRSGSILVLCAGKTTSPRLPGYGAASPASSGPGSRSPTSWSISRGDVGSGDPPRLPELEGRAHSGRSGVRR